MRTLLPLAFASAFLLTFFVALHMQLGLHDDAPLFRRIRGTDVARAFDAIDIGSVATGAAAIALHALLRGRATRAIAAGTGLAVVVLGWRYPSDVVAAFAVAGFWSCVAASLLRARVSLSYRGTVVAALAAAAAVVLAAIVAGRHPEAAAAFRTQPALVAAGVAFALVSLVTFGLVTALGRERT